MNIIWTENGTYQLSSYESEDDLENAILDVEGELFGRNRIYLPVKKKIGAKGGQRNIPDGYLIDLRGSQPRLYVVENELAVHDPLRHVAVQILQFSLSFESEPRKVKSILLQAIEQVPKAKQCCEEYAKRCSYRNVDHLLEWLVFEAQFSALVIIDELAEDLENVLVRKFGFPVEVLSLARYENTDGDKMYHFEPFLADVVATEESTPTDTTEIDTIVIPARDDGYEAVFLGENRWHAIRIHGSMRPQIQYIAGYRVAPISAITHIAPVKSIQPWKDTGKYVVNFAEPANEIGPIGLVKNGRVKPLQNSRYTTREKLVVAKTLDDVW